MIKRRVLDWVNYERDRKARNIIKDYRFTNLNVKTLSKKYDVSQQFVTTCLRMGIPVDEYQVLKLRRRDKCLVDDYNADRLYLPKVRA